MARVKLLKKLASAMKAARQPVGAPAPGEYALQVDEDGSVVVFGTNAAGEQVDISEVATLTAESSDPAILTVDEPQGMSVAYHAVSVGKATVTLTATWNDGSAGPFVITDPCDVDKDAVRGMTVNHGTPTIRG